MNRVKGKWQKLRRQVNKSKAGEGDSPGPDGDSPSSVSPGPVLPTVSAPSRWQKLIEQLQEEERLRSLATRDVRETDTPTSPSPPAGDSPTADTTVTVRRVAESRDNNTVAPGSGETPEFPKMSQVKGRWLKLRKQITADMARERENGKDAAPTPFSPARPPAGTADEPAQVNETKHADCELITDNNRKQHSSNTNVCHDATENIVHNGKHIHQNKLVPTGNIVPNGNVTQTESLADICGSAEPRKTTSVKGRWLKLKTRVTTANMAVQQLQKVRAQATERDRACAHGDVTNVHAGEPCNDISASQQVVSDRTYRATNTVVRKPRQVSWSHNHPTLAVIPRRGHRERVPLIARRSLGKSRTSCPFTRSSSVSSGYSSTHQLSPDGSDVMDDDVFRLDAVERSQTNTKWSRAFESSRRLQAAV